MSKNVFGKSTGNYGEDVSKRFGIQYQIHNSNPSSNPHGSPTQGQSTPPSSVGRNVGPNLRPTNQFVPRLPQLDICVECARCSVCFTMTGIFFVLTGSVMLAIAHKLDVGPNWFGPNYVSQLRITGFIELAVGIPLLVLLCMAILVAKYRVTAKSQNNENVSKSFEGPQPIISERIGNLIHPASLTFSDECSDHLPHNQHRHKHGSFIARGIHHNDNHGIVPLNHHDVSFQCHDHGASCSAFESPSSNDTVASTRDTSPSTTTSATTD